MKILHTGDIHLGDLNGPTKEGRNLRREDTLACMDFIVEKAMEERPDVTIIAGDLFNRSRVWADTALEDVNDALTRFIFPLCSYSANVVLLFGTENHDNPLAFDTIRKSTDGIANFHIYTQPTVESLWTTEGYVQIMAVPGFDKGRLRTFCPGMDKEAENRNATALINDVVLGLSTQLDKDGPSILVAHYTVAGALADNGSTFLAGQDVVITPATIDATGVSLACLGHIHHPQRLPSSTPAYYCGSVNQLNFNDEGTEHGFYIHDLDTEDNALTFSVKSTFVKTPERRHYTYRIGPEAVSKFIQTGSLETTPAGIQDAIVRVRYTPAGMEQEKALNRAELQKAVLSAGAFHVSEVLPEDVEELDAKDAMTEHDNPTDSLRRWLETNNVAPQDMARLMELAAPIIKQADDGRDADKHTGAFVPLTIEVRNYRSYTEAAFDFSPVHMAMVNGQNGVGKSSLFMDAIADCLFEQTRSEDIGGWVRDGTKSGAITFTFQMGQQDYRVIRTRTKSGRGTLALQRRNPETGAWEDESDTTMKLTQAKIERLLAMDCNTFCSIALIRQDAYGLFLEAGSDRRMEVLSDLLGLGIYTNMEELAKLGAKDQRRTLSAARDHITILEEETSKKEGLREEDKSLAEQAAMQGIVLESADIAISDYEKLSAMRQEMEKQLDEKQQAAAAANLKVMQKEARAKELRSEIQDLQTRLGFLPAAEEAAAQVEKLKAELADLGPALERSKAAAKDHEKAARDVLSASERIERADTRIAAATAIVSQRAEIKHSVAICEEIATIRARSRKMSEALQAAKDRLHEAERKALTVEAEGKKKIQTIRNRLETCEAAAGRLAQSGCPTPDNATCKFLADAMEAKQRLPELRDQLDEAEAEHEAYMDMEREKVEEARAALAATPDPAMDLLECDRQEKLHAELAGKATSLALAEEAITANTQAKEEAQKALEDATRRRKEAEEVISDCAKATEKESSLIVQISAAKTKADLLELCRAAKTAIEIKKPQLAEITEEITKLAEEKEALAKQVYDLSDRLKEMGEDVDISARRQARDKARKELDEIATKRGEIKAKLERIAEAEEKITELRVEITKTAAVLNDYTTLAQAFGLDGIQYMIIRSVVPEIMRQSNDILAAMTGGKMAVDIRTEKEQKSTKQIVNALEVWISNISGMVRPYLSHSGGEKVKIALAVTLGLADVKARRAGVQLGMLFIDEPPFLDADGTEAYADALTNMAARNPSMRILAISHDPTMKARFSQNIIVTGGENGSTVTME